MRYEIVLADIDNTLFDFDADARQALEKTFLHFGFPWNETERQRYVAINHGLWADFEMGKIEKSVIYTTRFQRYLEEAGLTGDPAEVNRYYMARLGEGSNYMPDAKRLLETLRAMGCRVFAATNGATHVQEPRLKRSGMAHLFEKIYISEQVGFQKPTAAYFDHIFAELGEDKRQKTVILGDSLTSDMQGGRNAGIATCFFGDPKKADHRCDHVITALMQFVDVVK